MKLPANFNEIFEAFLKKKKSFKRAEELTGETGMFETCMLEQLELESEGRDEVTKKQYYPGWTHKQLKFLLQCLRAQEI